MWALSQPSPVNKPIERASTFLQEPNSPRPICSPGFLPPPIMYSVQPLDNTAQIQKRKWAGWYLGLIIVLLAQHNLATPQQSAAASGALRCGPMAAFTVCVRPWSASCGPQGFSRHPETLRRPTRPVWLEILRQRHDSTDQTGRRQAAGKTLTPYKISSRRRRWPIIREE